LPATKSNKLNGLRLDFEACHGHQPTLLRSFEARGKNLAAPKINFEAGSFNQTIIDVPADVRRSLARSLTVQRNLPIRISNS
jgi:hypothetical protein